MLPVAFINSLLRYSLSELTLRFRTRLTKYLYNLYMRGYVSKGPTAASTTSHDFVRFVFYRLGNLDNRIPNADQLLTTDVEKFCASITEVFNHFFSPLLFYSNFHIAFLQYQQTIARYHYFLSQTLWSTRCGRSCNDVGISCRVWPPPHSLASPIGTLHH